MARPLLQQATAAIAQRVSAGADAVRQKLG
jgi:hypothetical protein